MNERHDLGQIDAAVDGWSQRLPDLDVTSMRTVLLLSRTMQRLAGDVEAAFAANGISAGEFDVLATLVHAPDHVSKPSELARTGMLSPAGMTHRLDRMEHAGLVTREPDPTDRRSTRIRLTPSGEATAVAAARDHVAVEADFLAAVQPHQRDALIGALEALLAPVPVPTDPT